MALLLSLPQHDALARPAGSDAQPAKVYVPYDNIKAIFEKPGQGVFLPYEDFQKLWHAAQGRPKDVSEAPYKYLISIARFKGAVKQELAELRLDLTVDILADGWVEVPIGLGEVGVARVEFTEPKKPDVKPLLRVVDGRYILMAKGKGRYELALDFVRQLQTEPGLNILDYHVPSAAVTTIELLIPEENLKVDVEPLLAASTSQVEVENAKATRLQAFLGSTNKLRLSWKPKTEAAPELEPVVICRQFQHIDITEALINYQVKLDYTIRRGTVDSFTVQLPGGFRVTDVSGANIEKWDIQKAAEEAGSAPWQILTAKLFSPATDAYTLKVRMERFLQESKVTIPIVPVADHKTLRQSGLIGITCSPRRLYSLKDITNLARVDTGRLPDNLQNQPGVTAYRFIAADYRANLEIETTLPRITVKQYWMLGVDSDRLRLKGQLDYNIERAGVFELQMNFPEPWKIESLGPTDVVDDYQLKGKGDQRLLHILLRKENTGSLTLQLSAAADRAQADAPVAFKLPLADENNLQLYQGQLILLLADQLRAEVQQLQQLQAIPLKQAKRRSEMDGVSSVMAFEFRAIDRQKPAGASFKIAVKPPQVSAVVHRLVDISRGSIEQQAVIQYRIRYAPVDTFYLKMPPELADQGVRITGDNIKEKPRIEQLPEDQQTKTDKPDAEQKQWAYYKVVLQSEVKGRYELSVRIRESFQPGQVGESKTISVLPILAAGKLSDQNGYIAIAKAETLAIGKPVTQNLTPADPGSSTDLPYEPHRERAALAFKYDVPEFELSFSVVTQKEAVVFTTIASGAIVEQALARDGMLNTHVVFLIQTAKGDRLPITLPPQAQLTAVLLNGAEAPVEMGLSENERIVRLPPSAGQVSKFVLEISYALKDVAPSDLAAPILPPDVLVQQTLWRLWLPDDYYLLGHNRNFSLIKRHECLNMLQTLGRRQPSQVGFKLPAQGKDFNFIRQGPPGGLYVTMASKESFSIIIWLLVIVAGVLMLKLAGFRRVLIIVAAGLLAALVHLYLPLLIVQTLRTGVLAAILVVVLWVGQWLFLRLPEIRKKLPARPSKKTATAPSAPKKQNEQPKQDKE